MDASITVALISLIGLVFKTLYDGKQAKKANLKEEIQKTQIRLESVVENQLYITQEKLLSLCNKSLKNGHISTNELKALTNLYNSYHKLGGNDFITELFERVTDLPLEG